MAFELRRKSITAIGAACSVLSLFFLMGCSSSPSAGEGKSAVQGRIDKQSEERIKLVKFEKSNGVQGERMGFKIYEMEFESEIEFTEECKWVTGLFGQELSFKTAKLVAEPKSGFSWNKFMDDSQNPGRAVTKGTKVQLSGVILFLKKERGWSVENLKLTRASPIGGADDAVGDTANGESRLQRALAQAKAGSSSPSISAQGIAAGSKGCVQNLKQLGLSVRLWSNDNQDKFPPSILSMSNEIVTPKTLVCPSDSSKSRVSEWSHFSEKQNCSYEFLAPNAEEEKVLKEVVFKCPVHGHVTLGDGFVRENNTGR